MHTQDIIPDIYIIIEHHMTVQIFDWAWQSVLLQIVINKSVFIKFDFFILLFTDVMFYF